MAGMNDEKMRMMEDEMNRFEAEIALPVLPPPPPPPPQSQPPVTSVPSQRAVIGANTYHQVQRRLEEQQMLPPVTDYQSDHTVTFTAMMQPVAAYGGIPPPPPPPLPPPPPPPPPPPVLIPHQVQRGPPMRHPIMRAPMAAPPAPQVIPGPPPPPAPPSFMPPPFIQVPGPQLMDASMVAPITAALEAPVTPMQAPVPAIVSATPLIYSAKASGDTEESSANNSADGDSNIDDIIGQKRKRMKTDSTDIQLQTPQQRAKDMSDRVRASTIVTVGPAVPGQSADDTNTSSRKKEKKSKKHIRMAGGQVWEDSSLADWEDDDFRIFCGDLGNDVTDEILTRAFSKYQSFMRAKVIRDKRSNKTKGFGFVSFKDPQDFIKAMKEMNGRYVGSRPIKLRKSTWRARNIETVRKKDREKATLIGLLTGR